MKNISFKINESLFEETERILSIIDKPMNQYLNEAVDYFNKYHKRNLLEKKLKNESDLVKDESVNVLREFEGI